MKNKQAFSLVEVLVVSVIVSLLASLALPAPGFVKKKNEELKIRQILSNVRNALFNYTKDHFDIETRLPVFPIYSQLKESGTAAAPSTGSTSSPAPTFLVDMLELALLKSTVAELDRRRRKLDFTTGYETYQLPYEKMILIDEYVKEIDVSSSSSSNTNIQMDKKFLKFNAYNNTIEILFNGDEIPNVFKNYSCQCLITLKTNFQYFSDYDYYITFYWFGVSKWDGSKYVITVDDNNLLSDINDGITPITCGSILRRNDYKYAVLENLVSGTTRKVTLQVWAFKPLPPYLKGDLRTKRYDASAFESINLEAPPGFYANPFIPPTPSRTIEITYWEAHVVNVDDPSKEYWVPLSETLSNIKDKLGNTERFVVDNIRFPSLDSSNISGSKSYYGSSSNFLKFFPLLDINGNGYIDNEDKNRFQNVTGELYYWEF